MPDMETYLASLGSVLDEAAPEIDIAEIRLASRALPEALGRRRRRMRPLWIAAGTAAATLVLVGGVALFLGNTGGGLRDDDAAGPVSTTVESTTSTATTLATQASATTLPVTTTPATTLPGPAAAGTWTRWSVDDGVFDNSGVVDIVDTGDRLVAVGNVSGRCNDPDRGAAVWTSLDGIEWTRADLPDEIRGGGETWAAAVGDSGIVAVGNVGTGCEAWNSSQTASAWHSQDGLEWTRVELPGGTDASAQDLVATESGYIAVGRATRWVNGTGFDDGVMWTSEDGIMWERNPGVLLNAPLDNVVAGESGLVAVGTVPSSEPDPDGDIILECCFAVWASPTGTEWTLQYVDPVPVEMLFLPGRSFDLAAGGPGFVATGEGNSWYSPDGATWQKTNPQLPGGNSVTWTGGGWIITLDNQSTAHGAAIWESTDGRVWTPVAPADSELFGLDHHIVVMTVRPGGPGLIAWGRDYDSAPDDVTLWTWAPTNVGG